MGIAKKPAKVKLIAGFIFKEVAAYQKAKPILIKKFGQTDYESKIFPFDRTDYYKDELGDGLSRIFVSFKNLIPPDALPAIKIFINRLEIKNSFTGKRLINIDPGYLDLAKLVLATTKDFCHRIYCGRGIFEEITLSFRGNSFKACEWTYPDYRAAGYIDVFNHIRQLYAKQIP